MSTSVMSKSNPSSIFSLGDILDSLGNTALSTFQDIAPVWAENALGLQSQNNSTAKPTFQTTPTTQLSSGEQLTTQNATTLGSGQTFTLSVGTALLIGGGLLLGFVMLKD